MPATAAERAYAHVKDLILSGDVAGGEPVSELAISDELGISRTPVHEAFLRLEGENLISLASRRGATVTPMAPDEARDVLEMREAIECSTARRVLSGRAKPQAAQAVEKLRDNVRRQRLQVETADVDAYLALDSDFHAILIAASRNAIAQSFHAVLRDRQHRLRKVLLDVGPDEVRGSFADHELMLAAAERGDADEFCRLVSTHVRRYRGIL